MNPALSVILLTTLLGTAQGLVLALFGAELAAGRHGLGVADEWPFFATSAGAAALLASAGLGASFFHLARPTRAWRSAAGWRTSWLSREVIVLPCFIVLAIAYAAAHALAAGSSLLFGALASLAALALFVCTGMIYACLRFVREWATPLTPVNFLLMGCANGFGLASVLAFAAAPARQRFFALGAIAFTLAGLMGRLAAWRRMNTISRPTTLQTAIGIKHSRIVQISQGFIGSSFNHREFFHGRSPAALAALRWCCLLGGFAIPLVLLALGLGTSSIVLLAMATLLQYGGLLAERWLFFAEVNHPQNLYYQGMA